MKAALVPARARSATHPLLPKMCPIAAGAAAGAMVDVIVRRSSSFLRLFDVGEAVLI